jgi:hypothetical protein
MKLSNSSISTFQTCGEAYRLKYVEKITSLYKGSALFFGSAIDSGLNHLLLHKDEEHVIGDSVRLFMSEWGVNVSRTGEKTEMPRNPYILYSKYDFDIDLLEKDDWAGLFSELKEYNKKTKSKIDSPLEVKNLIDAKLQTSSFQDLPEEDRSYYNFMSWLSLRRKGEILIKGYAKSLLPRIKTVVEVQKSFELSDEEKNVLNGVIDFVCVLDDDTLVVADNKTSSITYEQDSVKSSVQLSLYVRALNILNDDPEHEWKVGKIEHAAYFVMSKKLVKHITKTCKSCGHVSTGSHKTCDNMIETEMIGPGTGKPVRCNGEWDKTKEYEVNTQLIVDRVSETVQNMIMENAENVKQSIKSGVFIKNLNSCQGKFGPCEYKAYCWSGCEKNLKKGQ